DVRGPPSRSSSWKPTISPRARCAPANSSRVGLAWRISSVSASLTSKPTGRCSWSCSRNGTSGRASYCSFRPADGLELGSAQSDELLAKHDPSRSDLELANLRLVPARPGLENDQGATN